MPLVNQENMVEVLLDGSADIEVGFLFVVMRFCSWALIIIHLLKFKSPCRRVIMIIFLSFRNLWKSNELVMILHLSDQKAFRFMIQFPFHFHFQVADAEGCRPLHHAARFSWYFIFRMLLSILTLLVFGQSWQPGQYPREGNKSMVHLLLTRNALVDGGDAGMWSPLLWAAYTGCPHQQQHHRHHHRYHHRYHHHNRYHHRHQHLQHQH